MNTLSTARYWLRQLRKRQLTNVDLVKILANIGHEAEAMEIEKGEGQYWFDDQTGLGIHQNGNLRLLGVRQYV